MGQPMVIVPALVVLAGALIAAFTDVWKFKVHNLLTLPLLLAGVIYHTVMGSMSETGWSIGLLNSLLGALFGFGILIVFYIVGGMGAGDVKLMAAIGAWLGWPLTFYVFIASALAAGVYSVVLILAYGRLRETWLNLKIIWHRLAAVGRHLGGEDRIEAEVNRADRRRRVIPFAAMIAVGVVALLLWSWVGGALGNPPLSEN
ncbi:MAG TPA: A24 family peptidase [Gemmataceae bacterium]|nr:A24 family peptidase [Gemmataceae bacterium]